MVTVTGDDDVSHAPPRDVTATFTVAGYDWVAPLSLFRLTVGATVSMMTCLVLGAPVLPWFPAASVCVALRLYVPCADNVGEVVYVHVPPEHVALPVWVAW